MAKKTVIDGYDIGGNIELINDRIRAVQADIRRLYDKAREDVQDKHTMMGEMAAMRREMQEMARAIHNQHAELLSLGTKMLGMEGLNLPKGWTPERWEKIAEVAKTLTTDGNLRKGAWDQYREIVIDGKRFLPGPDHGFAFLCELVAHIVKGDSWPVIRDYDGNPVQTDGVFVVKYLAEIAKQIPSSVVFQG